jgi:hypothetical protein
MPLILFSNITKSAEAATWGKVRALPKCSPFQSCHCCAIPLWQAEATDSSPLRRSDFCSTWLGYACEPSMVMSIDLGEWAFAGSIL